MKRWNIINKLIKDNYYKSYLEIGYGDGGCFDQIEIETKTSNDIKKGTGSCDYIMSSDDFFSMAKSKNLGPFDIIFIDGNHQSEFAKKDLANALDILSDGGTVVMHDCNPTSEPMQNNTPIAGEWTGDVWKVFAQYRSDRDDLEMYVVDTDYGVGVVKKGKQKKLEGVEYNYSYFTNNQQEILNLKTTEEFEKM